MTVQSAWYYTVIFDICARYDIFHDTLSLLITFFTPIFNFSQPHFTSILTLFMIFAVALSPHAKARIAQADSNDSGDGDKEGGRVMKEFDIDDDDDDDDDEEESEKGGPIRQHLFEIEEDDRGDETEEEEEEEEDDDISRAAAATAFLDNEVEKREKKKQKAHYKNRIFHHSSVCVHLVYCNAILLF